MFTISINRSLHSKKGRAPVSKRMGLRISVLAGLGAMMLTILVLLPGCGSDSNTGGAMKGKSGKTVANSGARKGDVSIPLLTDNQGMVPGEMAKGKELPDSQRIEVLPGITLEELDARIAADRAKHAPKLMEVVPGITQQELEARVAADRARHDPRTMEVLAGITQQELEARVAADRARHDPRTMEVLPGITQAELDAKIAKQTKPDPRELLPRSAAK